MSGYIKLFRKITEWQWFNKDYMLRVWVYMLVHANHDDGFYCGIPVRKGQFVTGRKKMSHDLELSEQQIRTAWDRLKSTNEITITSTNQYSLITIVNWADYQDEMNEIANKQTIIPTIEEPSGNQRITTNKNDKNEKNDKKNINTKHKHGEFGHVRLTDEEYNKLVRDYSTATVLSFITQLDEGIEMKGYRYKNHYLAMRKWIERDLQKGVIKEVDTLPVYSTENNPKMDVQRFEELMERRRTR